MTNNSCKSVIDDLSGQINPNILPEHESPARSYICDDQNLYRPQREKIRGEIADYVLLMLGAPVIDIEIDKQQLTLAIDESLRIFEEWAPSSYFSYYNFKTAAGQADYQMPCDVGMIRDVHFEPKTCDAASQLGGSMPLGWIGDTGYGAGGLAWGAWGYNRFQPYWGYAGEWVLFKQYEETFERVSSRNGGWEFLEDSHTIKLYPTPQMEGGMVSVHYLQRKKDWSQVHQWMNEYALALSKIMIGRIRSKFTNIVSPGGGVSLDGQNILTEGLEEKKQLEKDLIYKFNDTPTHIVLG